LTVPAPSAAPHPLANRTGGEVPGALPPGRRVRLRLEQEHKVLELWEATRASGNELLLEIMRPKGLHGSRDRRRRRAARRQALLQPGHQARVVEAGAHAGFGLAGRWRRWYRARPALPWRGDPGPEPAHRTLGGELSPRHQSRSSRASWWAQPVVGAIAWRWLRAKWTMLRCVSDVANFTMLVDAWRNRRTSTPIV
jgi:hypothetical protein